MSQCNRYYPIAWDHIAGQYPSNTVTVTSTNGQVSLFTFLCQFIPYFFSFSITLPFAQD